MNKKEYFEEEQGGHGPKKSSITREEAWELLRKYNREPFHLQHARAFDS